jgi:hypothetical protein
MKQFIKEVITCESVLQLSIDGKDGFHTLRVLFNI